MRAVARVHDRITTYGFGMSNAVRVRVAEAAEAGSRFSVTGGPDGKVTLRVTLPGRHNVLNATAAYLAARQMGCPVPAIVAALGGFAGARRRFDVRLSTPQAVVVDDYAHHPVAVASFIDGLRQRYPLGPQQGPDALAAPAPHGFPSPLLAEAFGDPRPRPVSSSGPARRATGVPSTSGRLSRAWMSSQWRSDSRRSQTTGSLP